MAEQNQQQAIYDKIQNFIDTKKELRAANKKYVVNVDELQQLVTELRHLWTGNVDLIQRLDNEKKSSENTINDLRKRLKEHEELKDTLEKENLKLAKSELLVRHKPTDFYDIIIDINSIQTVKKGWQIIFSDTKQEDFFKSPTGWDYSIVSILGNYNNGKTFTLNKLFGTGFDASVLTATKGLSIKKVQNANVSHIILDTAGLESPIEIKMSEVDSNNTPGDEKSPDGVKNETTILANRTFLDHYLQDVVFDLADLFIVVLNDLKVSEQKNINRLITNLKNSKKEIRHLYVLHNFKDCTRLESANLLWLNQVVSIYQYGKVLDHIDEVSNEKIQWLQAPRTRHLFTMNDNSEEGKKYNSAVFRLLRNWLSYYKPPVCRKWNVVEEVRRSAKLKLSRYVRDNTTDLLIDWDEKVIRSDKEIELTDWKIDPSLGIIIGNSDVPCIDYENNEGRIIIFNIVGCQVQVEHDETDIVIWYKRFKDVTKYVIPSNDVYWNNRGTINLPETPNEATQRIQKHVDVSKHDISKLTTVKEGGLIRISIPKKIRKELVAPTFEFE